VRKVSGLQQDEDADGNLKVPVTAPPTSWNDFEALMGVRAGRFFTVEDDIKPHWDNYNDLGGLTELTDEQPKRASQGF